MSGDRDWRDGGLRGYWRGHVLHCEGGRGVPYYGFELAMCMLAMCNVSLTSVDDFIAGVAELAVRVL